MILPGLLTKITFNVDLRILLGNFDVKRDDLNSFNAYEKKIDKLLKIVKKLWQRTTNAHYLTIAINF